MRRKIESEAQQVLNAALAKERVAISPALVNAAEEKWVIYRDAECTEFAAINKGGDDLPDRIQFLRIRSDRKTDSRCSSGHALGLLVITWLPTCHRQTTRGSFEQ